MKTLFFNKITDISLNTLNSLDIKCILLDIDNTIKPYGSNEINNDAYAWISHIKNSGINIILCSNNYKKTVKSFAEKYNCDYVAFCLKPSPFGFFKAKLKSKTGRKNILVIGDQFFTDILGGKFLFFKTILVNPIALDNEGNTVKLRRFLTKKFTNRIINRENPFLKEGK